MNKHDAIHAIMSATCGWPTVLTTGYCCRIAHDLDDRAGNFYMTGSMGLASSIATGVAEALGVPAVVVDGDGALAMNPGALLTATRTPHPPIVHLVLDDRVYESTGAQETPTLGDIDRWAASLCYEVHPADELTDLAETVADMLERALLRPQFLRVPLDATGSTAVPGRIEGTMRNRAARFREFCSRIPVGVGRAGPGEVGP